MSCWVSRQTNIPTLGEQSGPTEVGGPEDERRHWEEPKGLRGRRVI